MEGQTPHRVGWNVGSLSFGEPCTLGSYFQLGILYILGEGRQDSYSADATEGAIHTKADFQNTELYSSTL